MSAPSPNGRFDVGRVFALVLGALALLGVAKVIVDHARAPKGTPPSPLSPTTEYEGPRVVREDFIGSAACGECHRDAFERWKVSTHGRAGGFPGQVKTLAPWDGTPIVFRDAVVIPKVDAGVYTFTIRRPGRPDELVTVDGFIGGGHMFGGGTQGAVTRALDGTWRFLPWDFIRDERVWFCNARPPRDAWVRITPEMTLADCSDWPPNRVLGETPDTTNCQSCHGSQIELDLDPSAPKWRTRIAGFEIGCEACHGPGRPHLTSLRDPLKVAKGDIGLRDLESLSKDGSLDVCWSCHALKVAIRGGYVSGKPLRAHYSVLLPDMADPAHYPDGRNRHFAYQESHLWSDCYVNGSMTCTSCHDPHSQKYRDFRGAALQGRFDDRQCTSCHPSKEGSLSAHTHHAPESDGSRCVACHMPFLQQPDLGDDVRYARSDHGIPIPRPGHDETVGAKNACKLCHEDQAQDAIVEQVKAWYGEPKPLPQAIRAVFAIEALGDRRAAGTLVLRPEERHAAALALGLGAFARKFLSNEMPSFEEPLADRLRALGAHPNLDVRALALASLHLVRGAEPRTRAFLADTLRAQGDDEHLVRPRWTAALLGFAELASERGDQSAVIALHEKALEIEPWSARLHHGLGRVLAEVGLLPEATDAFERSVELEPRAPGTFVALGRVLARRNLRVEARQAFEQALNLDQRAPRAHFNLAEMDLEDGKKDQARAHLDAALQVDRGLTAARLLRARLHAERGERDAALRDLDAALDFAPDDDDARAMREELAGESPPGSEP